MTDIAHNLETVRTRIATAARAAERDPSAITLLAVSKGHPAHAIRTARRAGQQAFGESYVQEALAKMAELVDIQAQWHFIGPLQSNKTKDVAEHFDWVHSVERLKIAERLSRQRPPQLPPLNVCIQVNSSGEISKAGIGPAQAPELARAILALPNLRLRGLMTIPARESDPDAQRRPFAQLRCLLDELSAQLSRPLDTLSMGMSDDLEAAILEGATVVRIGTAIFGARPRQGAGAP